MAMQLVTLDTSARSRWGPDIGRNKISPNNESRRDEMFSQSMFLIGSNGLGKEGIILLSSPWPLLVNDHTGPPRLLSNISLRILTDIRYISHVKCVIYSPFVENISEAQFKIFRLLFEASVTIFFNKILR